MKVFVKSLVFASFTLAATIGFADEGKKAPGTGPNPYSDCGIGSALFPSTKWAAVTSNVIWDIGTTAVTSATASPETCSGKEVETAIFIDRTYDELAEETAQGSGEHVTAMLNLMECSAASHVKATSQIRDGMAQLVNSVDYPAKTHVEKASAYYSIMSAVVANTCSFVDA